MSHHIYQTQCIVVGARDGLEANRTFFLLTEDLGLVAASAQGIRLERSKLRYALTEGAMLTVSLVRGREQWRVVGAVSNEHVWQVYRDNRIALTLFTRICALVVRLVPRDEAHGDVHALVTTLTESLKNLEYLTGERAIFLEGVVVARLLDMLGYFPKKEEYRDLLAAPLTPELVDTMNVVRSAFIADINRALQASHL